MVRSSAKNCNDVTIIVDPKEYDLIIEEMKTGSISLETRRRLSRDAFAHTARYDSLIATFLFAIDNLWV